MADRAFKRIAATIAALFCCNLWIIAMANENPYMERSKALLPVTLETDRKAADALARKSLSGLQAIYAHLQGAADKAEELVTNGGGACACDVAHSNLLIIIGFAINKLDGEGRYQVWMEDESLEILEDYRGLVSACSKDARSPAFSSITDKMIKELDR